jgi:hypothetical protein
MWWLAWTTAITLAVGCATTPARRALVTDALELGADRPTATAWYDRNGYCGTVDDRRTILKRCAGDGEPAEIQLGFDADDRLLTTEARYVALPAGALNTYSPVGNDRAAKLYAELGYELETRFGKPTIDRDWARLWRLHDREIELFIPDSRRLVIERHTRRLGGATTIRPPGGEP